MASALLLALLCSGLSQDPLPVHVLTGPQSIRRALGSGGLLPRESWAPGARRTPDGIETRGGARIHAIGRTTRIELAAGHPIEIDWRARLVGVSGALTETALVGLALRFCDGSELRVRPGNERGAREVSLVDAGQEHLLARAGRAVRGRRRARAFGGLRYYVCGAGDRIVSLVAWGPCLYESPVAVAGRNPGPRLLVCGDLIRDAVSALTRATPRNSAQYPLARKHAAFLERLVQAFFPAGEAKTVEHRVQRGAGLVFAQGTEARWVLRAADGARERVTFALHLAPAAEASLEFATTNGRTALNRVLPAGRQTRSRYLGSGVEVDPIAERLLPWPAPLAHRSQRRRALGELRAYLISIGGRRR